MIALDEDALVCDLAETYRVYDYRGLPPKLVATLACGLGQDSRIRQRQHGLKVPMSVFLIAQMADNLAAIRWMLSADAQHGKNRPEFVSPKLIEHEDNNVQFESPDAFEEFRAQLTGEGES